jgi:hypothetical protein
MLRKYRFAKIRAFQSKLIPGFSLLEPAQEYADLDPKFLEYITTN